MFLDDADFISIPSIAQSDRIQPSNALTFLQEVFKQSHEASEDPGQAGRREYGTLLVARVSEECDMKEEVMETLLSYLEVIWQYFCD